MRHEIDIEITDVAHGGFFVGRVDDMVVFVRGALPGETVRARVTKKRNKMWFAVADDVLDASSHRVEPLWSQGVAGVTGAADLSHANLNYQRILKSHVVRDSARRIGGKVLGERMADVVVAAVDEGDGWATRTRFDVVKMSTGAGMYREQSHDLVQLDRQPLGVVELDRLGVFTDEWDGAIEPGTRMHVVAPASGPDIVVTEAGTFTAPGKAHSNRIVESACTSHDSFTYEIASNGFWQVHHRAPNVLLQHVLNGARVTEGQNVLELFSGAGLFSVPLAKMVGESGRLTSVEGSAQAVRDATDNLQWYPWARSHLGKIDARTVAPFLSGQNVVIADPPRSGLGADLATLIAQSAVERVVLVSCDPAAMARDAGALISQRDLESVVALDIFPHTHHVEIVSVFGPQRK